MARLSECYEYGVSAAGKVLGNTVTDYGVVLSAAWTIH